MSEPREDQGRPDDRPADEEGIGAAAEEEGVVDQQAVLKDQVEGSDG